MEEFRAGMAPTSSRHEMRFEGSGGEYFKIWIVNLALTIVTLGIFSAWAKVRNRRYFYGNTFLDGHSFDYHGDPKRILLGRLIALGILLAYYLTAAAAPLAALIWIPVFLFAAPWLIRSSFRFNARNTSYRNIRFDFHGGYGGAFKAFILWPIAAGFSLGTLLPLAHRARDYYHINNHSFGGKWFNAVIPAGRLYLIYLGAAAILAAGAALAYMAFMHSGADFTHLPQKGEAPAPAMIAFFFLFAIIYLATFLLIATFIGTLTFNLAVGCTILGDDLHLESRLSPFAMAWIVFSNLLLVVITLGFFTPWAKVRTTRYLVSRLATSGPTMMDGFIASAAAPGNAIGEEVAGFFDFDFGL
jgi:uncharacterized membrane protein YjgN (DUF898 family)